MKLADLTPFNLILGTIFGNILKRAGVVFNLYNFLYFLIFVLIFVAIEAVICKVINKVIN